MLINFIWENCTRFEIHRISPLTPPYFLLSNMATIGSGRIAVICAVASGSVILAIAGVYWYRRFRQQQLKRLKPEDLKKVVAIVDKLWVYPLKSAYRVEVEGIECTKRGFVHDRCFYLQLYCAIYIDTANVIATISDYII